MADGASGVSADVYMQGLIIQTDDGSDTHASPREQVGKVEQIRIWYNEIH
jgi:hypothetical protein